MKETNQKKKKEEEEEEEEVKQITECFRKLFTNSTQIVKLVIISKTY